MAMAPQEQRSSLSTSIPASFLSPEDCFPTSQTGNLRRVEVERQGSRFRNIFPLDARKDGARSQRQDPIAGCVAKSGHRQEASSRK